MEVVVLYEGFNAKSEDIQVAFSASISRHHRQTRQDICRTGMEVIHVQRISGSITGTLVDGIAQDEQSVG